MICRKACLYPHTHAHAHTTVTEPYNVLYDMFEGA